MKNVIIILFLTGTLAGTTYSQMKLNFSAGVNHSNCVFENLEFIDTSPSWGYFLGIAPAYQLSEKIQFQLDLQYSRKGYQYTDPLSSTYEYGFSYFDIIPEVSYKLFDFLAVGLGVNYGLKLNEEYKMGDEDWFDTSHIGLIKSTDFGLTGVLRANYNNLFGFVRYNVGLKNINDINYTNEYAQIITNVKQSNRNLQVGVGYTLDFTKS